MSPRLALRPKETHLHPHPLTWKWAAHKCTWEWLLVYVCVRARVCMLERVCVAHETCRRGKSPGNLQGALLPSTPQSSARSSYSQLGRAQGPETRGTCSDQERAWRSLKAPKAASTKGKWRAGGREGGVTKIHQKYYGSQERGV